MIVSSHTAAHYEADRSTVRQVVFSGRYAQLDVIVLSPGEESGNEVARDADQFFRVEHGEATFVFNNEEWRVVRAGDFVLVPAGACVNVINASQTDPFQAVCGLMKACAFPAPQVRAAQSAARTQSASATSSADEALT